MVRSICYGMAAWIVIDFKSSTLHFIWACALLTLLFLAILPFVLPVYLKYQEHFIRRNKL